MKKKYVTLALGTAFALSFSATAFGGQWIQNSTGWKYRNDNLTYHTGSWQWIDGRCYYFTPEGYCLLSTTTPDGYTVDASGAWTVNGVVQTNQQTPSNGWNQINGVWKYYSDQQFTTSAWQVISGKWYYFDGNGNMVTGFQTIDGDKYYFSNDGSLKTDSFSMNNMRYTVSPDGRIKQSAPEYDWSSDSSYNSCPLRDNSNGTAFSPAPAPNTDNYGNSYAYIVFQLVNQERQKENLKPLEWDDRLAACAQTRAQEIQQSFSHTRPNGASCFTILSENHIAYGTCGENIASGQPSPQAVMTSWMNSTGHRNNIMSSNFGHIGVGSVYLNGTYYWVQLFTN